MFNHKTRLNRPIWHAFLAILISFSLSQVSHAEVTESKFCVWDPVGNSGPIAGLVKGMVPKALGWGVNFKLDVYTEEKIAATDFKAGVCDAVITTDLSVQQFNKFTGSFSAVGAIPGKEEFRTLLSTISSPKAAKLMTQGDYEVGGIYPIGSVFIYVRDKNVSSVEDLQGKKMAVLNNDPVIASMVRRVGGSVVPSSLHSMAGQFNNGSVDIIFAPAVAYDVMELYKGVENGGGIIEFPLLQTSLQMVIRHTKFPEGFGQRLREYSLAHLDTMEERVVEAESKIPQNYWINIDNTAKSQYGEFLRQSRVALLNEGLYESKSLKVLKKVRCKHSPTQAECASNDE